ncbi:MAG: protein kinase domain-containing protein [Syntrophobacteraceae bacterium]
MMGKNPEKRRRTRKAFDPPSLGVIFVNDNNSSHSRGLHLPRFVDILNLSESGALIKSSRNIDVKSDRALIYKDPENHEWRFFSIRAAWSRAGTNEPFHVGIQFLEPLRADTDARDTPWLYPKNIEFLAGMLLMDWVPRQALCDLLNCFKQENFSRGDRIIRQGDPGDYLYILQHGICSVRIEKEGEAHKIDQIQDGEIFGEMAIVTGEPRSAHVEAETDSVCWKLSKQDFESVADKYPDIRCFLTELVASRFNSCYHTADRTIGKYVIKRKIGKGGWSIVYSGVHETLNFPVAIKMMRHDMAQNTHFANRFRNEAQLIAGMNQRNIVTVYDIEERYRTIFIIMEYLEGSSLETVLQQKGRLPVARAVNFVVQACLGLNYAHQSGIVHLDIKPANLFILPNDRLKILDFGLACCAGSEDFCFLGTLHYTSPEQVLGNPVGPYTDLYSLGMTAYEMVTGARPFPEDDLNALVDMHVNEDIPDPAELVPDLPEPFRKFIIKSTRRTVEQRYQNTDEALKDLIPLARILGCPMDGQIPAVRKITSLLLSYSEEQELELKRSLERFSLELEALGVSLRSSDFDNF